jgi:hypothetical protein
MCKIQKLILTTVLARGGWGEAGVKDIPMLSLEAS